jgi:transposase
MRDTTLMRMALGLTPPWTVTGSAFDAEAGRIDIQIDFPAGGRFACPRCGAAGCPAHDTERKSWRHLNFFQHQAYLNARVPRVRCETCGIRTVSVPTGSSPVAGSGPGQTAASPWNSRPW